MWRFKKDKKHVRIVTKKYGAITADLIARNQGLAMALMADTDFVSKYGHNFEEVDNPNTEAKKAITVDANGTPTIEVDLKKKLTTAPYLTYEELSSISTNQSSAGKTSKAK